MFRKKATTNLLESFDDSEDGESDMQIAIELFPDECEKEDADSLFDKLKNLN